MKKINTLRHLIILILVLFSCSPGEEHKVISQTKNQDFIINELVKVDFLEYADSSIVDSVRQAFIKDGNIFRPEINRYLHIDAEELAEGNFDFFKTELTKILNKRGLEITFSTTENFEKLHEVKINNEKFILFDTKNIADYSMWEIAPRRFFEKINQVLQKSKSQEQFYLIYSGNDLGTLLLTEEQFKIISKINEDNPKEIPYKP
jgi:hypothetical protein